MFRKRKPIHLLLWARLIYPTNDNGVNGCEWFVLFSVFSRFIDDVSFCSSIFKTLSSLPSTTISDNFIQYHNRPCPSLSRNFHLDIIYFIFFRYLLFAHTHILQPRRSSFALFVVVGDFQFKIFCFVIVFFLFNLLSISFFYSDKYLMPKQFCANSCVAESICWAPHTVYIRNSYQPILSIIQSIVNFLLSFSLSLYLSVAFHFISFISASLWA